MDPHQQRPQPTHLKPPPPAQQQQQHQQQRTPSSSTPNPNQSHPQRPALTIHPKAQLSDTTIIQGTHPISIGAHTIIHPRARLYSHEGPILIAENCIISEKTVIGTPSPVPFPSAAATSTSTNTAQSNQGSSTSATNALPIRIAPRVVIGPAVSIAPGAQIHSGAAIDALAVINRRVSVGAHARVCAGCEVAAGTAVGEWVVVWGRAGGGGGGGGLGGQRRRRRETRGLVWGQQVLGQGLKGGEGGVTAAGASGGGAGVSEATPPPLEAKILEDARLMVLDLEREAVGRLLVAQNLSRRRG